jgi:hypothetical protein
MTEQVTTLFDSDEVEAEVMEMVETGKRLVYAIGSAIDKMQALEVKRSDLRILLPARALACIKMAAPVELLQGQVRGRKRVTLFGCRVGINKQNDRIFVGQEVKV